MSDEQPRLQFTIANIMHATFWFAVTVVLISTAIQTPVEPFFDPEAPGVGSVVGAFVQLVAAFITFGCAIGALFGKALRGAAVAAILLVMFLVLLAMLALLG